jgi:3-oxoacyl-[acyl-carrier protein] reductase
MSRAPSQAGLLDGRVAIITGAGSGIGRAISLLFSQQGARVVLFDVDQEGARETLDLVRGLGGTALIVAGDVTSSQDVERCVVAALSEFSQVDVLVNNAGLQWGSVGLDMSQGDWQGVFDLNLTGQFKCARAVAPHMKQRRYGKLVGIASDAGRFLSLGSTYAYVAAKGGVHGLYRSLAEQLGPWTITANVVSPGNVMTARGRRFMEQPQMQDLLKDCPLGRWTEPDEIAKAALFFASDLSSHVTGVTMSVNGGWHMVW